jgi:hypothetical protein
MRRTPKSVNGFIITALSRGLRPGLQPVASGPEGDYAPEGVD